MPVGGVSPAAVFFGVEPKAKVYAGSSIVFGGGGSLPLTLTAVVSGDSTVAEFPIGEGINPVATYISGLEETDISVPGDTINEQRTLWEAIPDYSSFRAVIVQIGLNDVLNTGDATAAIGRLQDYIDQIATDTTDCAIYVAQMIPCAQRWYNLWGPTGGAIGYQQWLDINDAIAGNGANAITGVAGRITSHVAQLAETRTISGTGAGGTGPYGPISQSNCLKLIYDTGDRIHENNGARVLIAAAWRAKLVADGLLT